MLDNRLQATLAPQAAGELPAVPRQRPQSGNRLLPDAAGVKEDVIAESVWPSPLTIDEHSALLCFAAPTQIRTKKTSVRPARNFICLGSVGDL